MTQCLSCPTCSANDLSVCNYESMMVLRQDVALFSVRCPHCGTVVTTLQTIPLQLREEVRYAAHEVGAGMGKEV
ncbi:MAG: UDP-N-acetylmuramoylalanyl-D-glutamate--2,6-diaminopimelate ligase [Eggerthellaceae bacterium]|jgi:uncharacterized Zn finger protein